MNRLTECINLQLKSIIKSSVIFMAIYFAVSIVLFSMTMISFQYNSNGSFTTGFYIGAGIFIFVYVIASYKEMFNYLLMFGNTRKNILLSFVITSAALSVSFSIISTLVTLAEKAVSMIFGFSRPNSINLLNLIYKNSGFASETLWLAAFFFLICSFSLLYGALAYKLGNVFITIFWVCFGLAFIGLPALLDTSSFKVIGEAFTFFFRFGSEHGILLAPINFIAASAILCITSFLASRRQPQAA
jgi:hypothetical protein